MGIGKTMEPQKQNVHHIFLWLLIILLGISSLGVNVVEARLGTSFINHARLLRRQGVQIQSIDSNSKGAARLLQSVPGKEFYSVKGKRTAPPSGPSHGGNSIPFDSLSDHRPHALHPSLPSPTVVHALNVPETESKVKGKGPVSGPSHGGDSQQLAPAKPPPPPPPSPTLASH